MSQSNRNIYLDHNAGTPLRPEAYKAMLDLLQKPGNPSAPHRYGRDARMIIEQARADIAHHINAPRDAVIFTSGAPEANNTVFMNFFDRPVISTTIEHPTVARALPGDNSLLIPVSTDGLLDMDIFERALSECEEPPLVSIIWVNNETGVIQPIKEICSIAKKYDALVHTDAAQALGRIEIDFQDIGVDFMTLSSHKCGGPQGIGALIANPKIDLQPLIVGGGQEKNRRAGTENTAAIAGFSAGVKATIDNIHEYQKMAEWRNSFEKSLLSLDPETRIFGQNAPRVANTIMFACHGITADAAMIGFDLEGIAISNGSACSSGRVTPSHVIQAMGATEELAKCALRISLGWNSQEKDLDETIDIWKKIHQRAKS